MGHDEAAAQAASKLAKGRLPVVEQPKERDVPKLDTVAPSANPERHGLLQQWSERCVSVDKNLHYGARNRHKPVAQNLDNSVKRLRLESQKGRKE